MRILLSAYSCQPNRGSEPGIGWNTAVELGRTHEVWVLVDSCYRAAIVAEIAARPPHNVHFEFHDLPPVLREAHHNQTLLQLHYYLWQYTVYFAARRLHRKIGFDLACHVTFGRAWSPSLVALLPIPFMWGPVGGGETVPRPLRSCLGPKARLVEAFKDLVYSLVHYDPFLRLTVRRSAFILANSADTARKLNRVVQRPIEFMDTAVIDREAIEMIEGQAPRPDRPALCFATLTRLTSWKGVQLGLRAFQKLDRPEARYWIVGEGPERAPLEKLAQELGVADRVTFWGNPSRAEWLRILKSCDALLHPAMSNTFNMICIEAMLCAKPVICLRTGALAERVDETTGYVAGCPDPGAAVENLAAAMRQIAERPGEAKEKGERAKEKALASFTWDVRINRLNQLIESAVQAGEPG